MNFQNSGKPKSAGSLLQSFTKDPQYVNRLQGLDEPTGRDWDNRFSTSKMPQYDALNDKFCKFNMRRRVPSKTRSKMPPPNMMQAWAPTAGERLPPLNHPSNGNSQPKLYAAPLPEKETLLAPGQTVEQMFAKSKQRIIRLWDELGIPEQQRLQFAQQAMSLPTMENLQQINDEIQRLLDRRNAAVQVEKMIEVREGFLYLLQELAERFASGMVDKDRASRELFSLVAPFRNSSLDVVEAIVQWRETMRASSTALPYLWKGVSYLYKMQSDLFFLFHSGLGQFLDFEVKGNSLLDPRKVDPTLKAARRQKDNKDVPKERLDKAERCLVEEQKRIWRTSHEMKKNSSSSLWKKTSGYANKKKSRKCKVYVSGRLSRSRKSFEDIWIASLFEQRLFSESPLSRCRPLRVNLLPSCAWSACARKCVPQRNFKHCTAE